MKERLLEETRDKYNLKFIWTQTECDIVKDDNNSTSEDTTKSKFIKPIRKKNLTKIYSAFPDLYTPSNTLIIDDTDAKLADHFENHLKIDEFTVADPDIDFTADRKLLQLKKYLDRLIKEDPEDLRTFLAKYDLSDF